jgi:hypothetical protein
MGAAGTFVIQRPIARARLRAELTRRLPFAAEVVICNGGDLVKLAESSAFAGRRARPGVVRFVSILTQRPRLTPRLPARYPPTGPWLLQVLGREKRFVFGQYRRHMKVIGYLGELDKIFGVPATTRSWNTIQAIARVLHRGPH